MSLRSYTLASTSSFYNIEDGCNLFVKEREHRLLSFIFPLLIHFTNTLVYTSKFFIALVLFNKTLLRFCKVLQTTDDFIQSLCFLVELCYRVNHKTMFLESFHKGFTQRNELRIVLVEVLGKRRNGTLPFLLQFHHRI